MNGFTLHLQSATQYQRVEDVASFVASDDSGTFGLLPQHERFMTVVEFGLARYRGFDNVWYYLALPGALVYFVDNALYLSTRRYVVGDDCPGRRGTSTDCVSLPWCCSITLRSKLKRSMNC